MAKKNSAATNTAATKKTSVPAKEEKLTPFQLTLKKYLDNYAQRDELFAFKYGNKDKSIAKCAAYIIGEAQKQKGADGCAVLSDEVVYGLAVHYYEEDEISLSSEQAKAGNASCNVVAPEADEEISKKVEFYLF